MRSATVSAVIRHPREQVFALAADPMEQLKWDPAMLKSVEKISPGPLEKNARFRGAFKGMGTMEYEFEEYDPPQQFVHRTRMMMGQVRHFFTFEAVPEGTRLTQRAELEPNLLGRIAGGLMMRMLRNRFRVIASEIGEYMDAAPGSGGAVSP